MDFSLDLSFDVSFVLIVVLLCGYLGYRLSQEPQWQPQFYILSYPNVPADHHRTLDSRYPRPANRVVRRKIPERAGSGDTDSEALLRFSYRQENPYLKEELLHVKYSSTDHRGSSFFIKRLSGCHA